jgi:hypothetical protein
MVPDVLYVNLGQGRRLSTHEDARYAHVHKLLGALVLFNFARRAWLTATTGDAGMDGGLGTLAWIAVHGLLHLTSFQFALAARSSCSARAAWPRCCSCCCPSRPRRCS